MSETQATAAEAGVETGAESRVVADSQTDNATTPSGQGPSGGTPDETKTFTADDADRMFAARIGRLEKKFSSQLEEATQKTAQAAVDAFVKQQQDAREAEEQAAAEAQAEAESATQQAATATPEQQQAQSTLAQTLQRVRAEADKRKAVEDQLAAERAKTEKLQRDVLVQQVAAEKRVSLAPQFLALVEGDDAETISQSLEALMELGREQFQPKSIGAPNQPPQKPPDSAPTANNQATRIQRMRELQDIINDPSTREAQRTEALNELGKL